MRRVKKLLNRCVTFITPSRLYADFGRVERTVLIVGAARSGTTYFTKLVNCDNDFRYIFEPFHPGQCSYMKELPDRPYLRFDEKNWTYQQICKKVFLGKVRSNWVDRFNARFISNQRLVKSTRVMMMLGWIHHHFPAIPIIYLMRHPLAVVASRLKIAEKYPDWFILNLDSLFSQSSLIQDYPAIQDIIRNSNYDEFQRQVVYWCILNKIALDQLGMVKHALFFYEQCLTEPETVFLKARQFIENYRASRIDQFNVLDNTKHQRKLINIDRQIKKTTEFRFKSMSGSSTEARLEAWRKQFNEEQIGFTSQMLEEFGLDRYYDAKQTHPIIH